MTFGQGSKRVSKVVLPFRGIFLSGCFSLVLGVRGSVVFKTQFVSATLRELITQSQRTPDCIQMPLY